MKVSNETEGEFFSFVEGEWYQIQAGDSIEVEDFNVAMQLVAAGASVDKAEHDAMILGAAKDARAENSKTASASASEGDILDAQRQQTIDPATGAVTADPAVVETPEVDASELKGAALEEALTTRGLSTTGTADEKRARVAEHDKAQAELAGQSNPPAPAADENGVQLT